MKKKRRYARRRLPAPKLWLLLLQSIQPQPPMLMKCLRGGGCKMIMVVITPLIRMLSMVALVETKSGCLRLLCQESGYDRHASRRTSMVLHCCSTPSFVQRSWDDDAESFVYFNTRHAYCNLL
jgi:hypothetical protein